MLAATMSAEAQLTDAPKPIQAPPIPKPPKLGPAPTINLGAPGRPPRPAIDIPAAPNLAPVAFPGAPIVTPADKTDPVPPPRSGIETGPPPTTSPGADASNIEETAFLIDPASSQIPNSAQAKLRELTQTLGRMPMARVEIRAFAPVKGQSESDARRLALARCLAVRDVLVQNGVPDDRIDVRALGSEPKEQNADRIELYVEH